MQTFFSELLVVDQFAMPQVVEDGAKVGRIPINYISSSLILLQKRVRDRQRTVHYTITAFFTAFITHFLMLWSVEFLFCICACDSIRSNVDGDMLLKNCLQSLFCLLLVFYCCSRLCYFLYSPLLLVSLRVCVSVPLCAPHCVFSLRLKTELRFTLVTTAVFTWEQKNKKQLVTESQRKLCAHVCQQPTSLAPPGYMWQACLVVMSWLLSLHIYAHPACALLHNECLKHIAL